MKEFRNDIKNGKINIEKKEQRWMHDIPKLQTIPPSYCNQNSNDIGTKTDTQINGTEQGTQK